MKTGRGVGPAIGHRPGRAASSAPGSDSGIQVPPSPCLISRKAVIPHVQMVFSTLQSKGPLRAPDLYPSFVDNETEAQRPSASRQASHSEKEVRQDWDAGHAASDGRSPFADSQLCLPLGARGSLPAGASLRLETQKVPLVSGTLFSPSLKFSQWAQQPPPICIRGPAKSLSNVPQEKARPVHWAPWLARHHPLICCLEIKHGGDKQLGGVEMSARHPEISSEHVTRRW